jgi:hypothetical protein
MKTVNELNKNELEELRTTYYIHLLECGNGDYFSASRVPMDEVKKHYEGVNFVEDDFFCNIED